MNEFDTNYLLDILPKLIKENDTIKGAIISILSGIVATKEDIKDVIRAMDKRFEAIQLQMDKRFEAIQLQMDKRFEAMDKRFEAMQLQMNKRFEAMDKRFEAMQLQMDKRFNAVDKHLELIELSNKQISLSVNRIESKEGKYLENTVLELMKETLELENILSDKIRGEAITDPDGEIFYPGYTTDIDVLIENGNIYLVEVKATVGSEDIAHFLQNVKLYEKQKGKKITRPIIVALRINQNTKVLAENRNIRVIAGNIN